MKNAFPIAYRSLLKGALSQTWMVNHLLNYLTTQHWHQYLSSAYSYILATLLYFIFCHGSIYSCPQKALVIAISLYMHKSF